MKYPARHESQNKDSVRVAQAVLDSLDEHIAILDSEGKIIAVNKAWKDYSRNNHALCLERSKIGKNYLDICMLSAENDKRLSRVYKNLKMVLEGEKPKYSIEYPSHSESSVKWFLLKIKPVKSSGKLTGAIVTHTDITRRKLAELESRRLAVTDSMTGILNRKAGIDFLQFQIRLSRKNKTPLTICFIDLDNLKFVNDNYGHKEGDKVIKSTVKHIKSALRETDSMCRLGGDEILLVLPNTTLMECNSVVTRICGIIDNKNDNLQKSYRIEFSYGIAEYDSSLKCTPEELIDIADTNMYKMKTVKKKRHGGNYQAVGS